MTANVNSHQYAELPTTSSLPPAVPPKPEELMMNRSNGSRSTTNTETSKQHTEQRAAASLSDEDVVIAIMGVTGAGKSTFISLLTEENVAVGHNLESCTTEVSVYSFREDTRTVYIIDTPGFDDTHRSDTDVLKDIAYFLTTIYSNKVRLAGIIYLHRITDLRMGGSALKNLNMFKKLCGDNGLSSVILATTMWANAEIQQGGKASAEQREQNLRKKEFWGALEARGSKIMRHTGTAASARAIVSELTSKNTPVILDIQTQMVEEKKTLDETSAGQFLGKEINEARKKLEVELAEYKESMEAAMEEKDQELVDSLQVERQRVEQQLQRQEEDRRELKTTLEALKQEKNEQYRSLERKLEEHSIQAQERSSSERGMVEQYIQQLQTELRDKERKHAAEMAEIRRSQQTQSRSEAQQLHSIMMEREQLYKEQCQMLEERIRSEKRARRRAEEELHYEPRSSCKMI